MPLRKSGRPTKRDVVLMKVDDVMSQDDETTVKELVVAFLFLGQQLEFQFQFRRSLH